MPTRAADAVEENTSQPISAWLAAHPSHAELELPVRTRANPTLGVVLLDCEHYTDKFGRFAPSDPQGLGTLPTGFFECPATWPVSTVYAVAPGAQPHATVSASLEATEGLVQSVATLAPHCDLIVADCGFFWAARARAQARLSGTTLISGLDLLDLAGVMTSQPIGLLTFSEADVRTILAGHPLMDRIRVVGLIDQPNWSGLDDTAFAHSGKWTVDGLRRELIEVVERELRHGALQDAGVLVLECTCLPQFRAELRGLTTLPILDAAAVATMALT
jgi:hypothetical protein